MKKETKRAIRDAFAKLSFRSQAQNPVMLMVYLSACLTTVLLALALAGISDAPWGYIAAICVVLWATVLFGNFAESLAEGRGKAQADALRSAKRDVEACLIDNAALADAATMEDPSAFLADRGRAVGSATLKRGQVYLVRAGEQVPADGEVIMGAASVDESAITGESAPVVRESGGDRSSITGGTTVLSDWLVARVTAEAGQSFLDKMIAMVESAARKKTPNEQALELLLIALTLVFLAVSLSLYLFGAFTAAQHGAGNPLGITSLVALFVCLAPTTIGALLSAIGIAGMSRLNRANVLAMSGRAVEAAGDVDVLLLCVGHGDARKFLEATPLPDSVRVIDLSQDFRLSASSSIGGRRFVYGLPEMNRERIRSARNIANPGCFATCLQLGMLPLAAAGLLRSDVHVTALTGSTGAGQKLAPTSHFSQRVNNLSVYKAFTHQHLNEIGESVRSLMPSFSGEIDFVPYRGDFARGIIASIYTDCDLSEERARKLYEDYYADAALTFVSDRSVCLKQVVNTSKCVLSVEKHGDKLLVVSAIDNLLKGASGQAVQNMNLMFGLDERAGLRLKPVAF